jgi:hypothetical protein
MGVRQPREQYLNYTWKLMFISEIIIRKIIYQKPNQNHENDNTVAWSNETRQKYKNVQTMASAGDPDFRRGG